MSRLMSFCGAIPSCGSPGPTTNRFFRRKIRSLCVRQDAQCSYLYTCPRGTEVNPADAQKQSPGVEKTVSQIRGLVQVLPEYFAHRQQWRVSLDGTTGRYVITTRDANRVVLRIE